jgi:hypothetical protein
MSLRELVLQGGNYPTIYPKECLNTQPITVLNDLSPRIMTAEQIFNGVIYSTWNGTPGNTQLTFPSITDIDNYIGSTQEGNSFTIELYVQRNAKISYTIQLGSDCYNIDGGTVINTTAVSDAPRYFKIIAIRQSGTYSFYSPSY